MSDDLKKKMPSFSDLDLQLEPIVEEKKDDQNIIEAYRNLNKRLDEIREKIIQRKNNKMKQAI